MFELHHPHQQSIFLHTNNSNNKLQSNANLYAYQPTVIELVEVAPPPPRRISSVINSSSAYSSSYASSSSYESEVEDDEDDEEESVCSSYCSSDLAPEDFNAPTTKHELPAESLSATMKRVLCWRENFDAAICTNDTTSSPLKRKVEQIEEFEMDNDDTVSHSSKRSRSVASSSSRHSISSAELDMHPCPACDAFFPTQHSLRQHGRDAGANEACWVAVEYAFEQ